MAIKLGDPQKGRFADRMAEFQRVTFNCTRDYDKMMELLQQGIEGKFAPTIVQGSVPSWYVSPEQQLARVNRISAEWNWGFTDADFPSVPENFTPSTATEVLLLSVYLPKSGRIGGLQRTFDDLWRAINPPEDYTKHRWDGLESDSKHLRPSSGTWKPGVRWVAFDPNAYHKLSPEKSLEQATASGQTLAGTEVLMAALLFPDWGKGFDGTFSPYPNMSGLQFFYDGSWSRVPYLNRWDSDRQFLLSTDWADGARGRWASPVVREC